MFIYFVYLCIFISAFKFSSPKEWWWNWIFILGYKGIWIQKGGRKFTINKYINSSSTSKKAAKRNTVYMKCRDYCAITRASKKTDVWTDLNSQCSSCIKYEIWEKFHSSILPRQKEILEYLLTIKMKLTGKHVDNSREVAMDLKLHWIYCNVYPLTVNAIKKRNDSIFDEYTYLMRVSNDKKKDTYWNWYSLFINNQISICDIIADPKYIQTKQKLWQIRKRCSTKTRKKIHLLGGVSHLLIVNGKLLIRGGKNEKNVAEMKVMMTRILAGQVNKKSRRLLVMI